MAPFDVLGRGQRVPPTSSPPPPRRRPRATDCDRPQRRPSTTARTPTTGAATRSLVSRWDELADAGIPVAALTDTPTVDRGGNAPECVAKHRDDTDACILDSAEGMGTPAMRAAAERARAATLVDLTDAVCPGGTCRPVFGNVLVQRDGSHLTDTFVRAAAPALEAPLRDLVTGSR